MTRLALTGRTLRRSINAAAAGLVCLAALTSAAADTLPLPAPMRSAGLAATALRSGPGLLGPRGSDFRPLLGPSSAATAGSNGPAPTVEPAPAPNDPAAICDAAAHRAATETGVPVDLLLAIGRAESGRTVAGRFAPWPWTVNVAGNGRYFADRDAATRHAEAALQGGTTNVDIGCFQINHRWHGRAFASLEDMFDPDANARYAADFLLRLHRDAGTWASAAGAYHSRTPELRQRYSEQVARLRSRLPPEVLVQATGAAAPSPEPAPPPGVAVRSGPILSVTSATRTTGAGGGAPRPESILPPGPASANPDGASPRPATTSRGAIGFDRLTGGGAVAPGSALAAGRAS
jgi:hypothetical protein